LENSLQRLILSIESSPLNHIGLPGEKPEYERLLEREDRYYRDLE